MNIQKAYLEKSDVELECIENESYINTSEKETITIDKLCLNKTLDIAKIRSKKTTLILKKDILREYRNYAINSKN